MVTSPRRFAFRSLLLALLLPLALLAQGGGTGRIAGRVFNPATQEYVRNAEVSVEGTNLTAGEIALQVAGSVGGVGRHLSPIGIAGWQPSSA